MADPLKIIIESTKGSGGGSGVPGSGGRTSVSQEEKQKRALDKAQKAMEAAKLKKTQQGADAVVDISKGSLGAMGALIGTAMGGPAGAAVGGAAGGMLEDTAIGKGISELIKFSIQGPFVYGMKKAMDNSEMAKGIKKMAKEGFGAIGDTILFGVLWGYNKIAEKFDVIKEAIEFSRDPVKYVFEAEWEDRKESMRATFTGILDIANLIEGWGEVKVMDLFGHEIQVKDLFGPFWGVVEILDMFHDEKITMEQAFDMSTFALKDLFDDQLESGDVFKTGGFTLPDLFRTDNENNRLGPADVFKALWSWKDLFDPNNPVTWHDIWDGKKVKANELIAPLYVDVLINGPKLTSSIVKGVKDVLEDVEDALNDIPGIDVDITPWN